MKVLNYIALSAFLAVGLSSCETREILGEDNLVIPDGSGLMSLSVKAEKPVSTKADEVDTSTFPVTIQGTSDVVANVVREYDQVSEVPNVITLPVGIYIVSARQTDGEIPQEMSAPYYAGKTENVKITNETAVNNVSVICRMQNNRIQVKCSSEFLATFKEWSMTIDDWDPTSGEDEANKRVLTFTKREWENGTRQIVYWYLGENGVPHINVKVKATTQNDSSVQFSGTFTRAMAEEGYEDVEGVNFVGGDAIVITLEPGEEEDPIEGTVGINVKAEILFSDKEDVVEIPVTDASTTDPDEDNTGGGDTGNEGTEDEDKPIVISEPDDPNDPNDGNYLTTGVTFSAGSEIPNVQIDMDIKNGVKSMIVLADPAEPQEGEPSFENALRSFPELINGGLDFLSDSGCAQDLKNSGLFTFPEAGDVSYSFKLNETMLNMMSSFVGTHVFHLTVIDMLGNEEKVSLSVIIEAAKDIEEGVE